MPWSSLPAGGHGNEGGIVVADEEFDLAARITLERDAPGGEAAVITCGVYGWMVHTHFCDSIESAKRDFDAMKIALVKIVALLPLTGDPEVEAKSSPVLDAIGAFADAYP